MKHYLTLALAAFALTASAAEKQYTSPDGQLAVTVSDAGGHATYAVRLGGTDFVLPSALGMKTNIGDFTTGLAMTAAAEQKTVSGTRHVFAAKKQDIAFTHNTATCTFAKDGKPVFDVEFAIGNNDVAFRYKVYPKGGTLCCVIQQEATAFTFPDGTTTFLCPQSKAMTGFARTAPSYETHYTPDDAMGKNGQGYGFSFPCLFRNADKGWALVSETGVTSLYCASRLLSTGSNQYAIGFPQPEEYNGNGTAAPGLALPGYTPWRTITLGTTLKPVVETTIPYEVVEQQYEPSKQYRPLRGTWSWIIAGDPSMNYDTQREYIDFAAAMGYESVLIDALWDTQVGRDRVEQLLAYAKQKGVGCYLWYNSNGYWNDAPQGPRNIMNRAITRRAEMRWMQRHGVLGIKVDFIGSDKQQTMQLYEDILADANDYGIEVIFHGCTLPRGWEAMYPNFVAAEAVRASENMNFSQGECDNEAFCATIHPFVRNAVASMDFGGSTLNKHYNKDNQHGSARRTSDVFALATAVMFQSPVQHFALAPNNLTDAPAWAVDFMKAVPTTWSDVRFIDGYPGRYAVLARRHGDTWYVVGINAQKQPLKLKLQLPMFEPGTALTVYADDAKLAGSVKTVKQNKQQTINVTIPTNGGLVIKN